MASLTDKVAAEIENISTVLTELDKIAEKKDKSIIELSGIATFIHNFYTGVENIIKQILISKNIIIPTSSSWHKELLELAFKNEIITDTTESELGKFLVFRHFFVHSYSIMLDEEEMKPLFISASDVFNRFKIEIEKFIC